MDHAPHDDLTPRPRLRSHGRLRRVLRRALLVKLVVALVLGLALGTAYLRLATGPFSFDGLSARVATALAERLGPGWTVGLRDSALELDPEGALALRAAGLEIRNPEGVSVIRAPLAVVSLDTTSLLTLSFQPRAIEFRDLQVRAVVHRDGTIAFAASDGKGDGKDAPTLHTLPSVEATRAGASPISTAVASIIAVVFDPAGIVGALDRARLTNARLTLVDEAGADRAVFQRVDGVFRRGTRADARAFEMRLDGPHGPWRFGADVRQMEAGRREGIITLDDLPVTDLLLLSGQSKLPLSTDIKLSGRADVALSDDRLTTMRATLRTGEGSFLIKAKDVNPVTVETVSVDARWDEARRTLSLPEILYRGAGNEVRLKGNFAQGPQGAQGQVAQGQEAAWTLGLSGRDAVLHGAGPQDPPVRIATLEAALSGRDGGLSIDRIAVSGERVEGTIAGSAGTAADRSGLTLRIRSDRAEGRTALRLWPENIAPAVRGFLVDNVRTAEARSVDIALAMSADEFAAAAQGEPMPDAALKVAFEVGNGTMQVSAEAPPLTKARVAGTITGRTTTVRGATAEIRMPDGRTLALGDGSFSVSAPVPNDPQAQVGMRLTGGVDALVSLLQTKLFRGLANLELDPATLHGQADVKVDFPLALAHVPEVADMPVTVAGTLTEVGLDKVLGKERVEGGKFVLAYDRAGFTLRGDAKLTGTPISVDLRQPKGGGAGEMVVNTTLDEALRARRGLPVGPLLTGPIPARITVATGKPGKTAARVEADLTRASTDGLLPGWTKASGRAAKASLTVSEAGSGYEIRDLALDAGPTMLRGTATIGGDGQLDRADLTTLKIATGDDMRAQVERAGGVYKVSLKGAVADARPMLRTLTGGKEGAKEGGKDIDAEVSLGILSGYNDEALTNASIKASLRKGDLRQLALTGRFRASPVSVQVARVERGAPVLSAQTNDAGAALRFLDIYKRMQGGQMTLQTALNDGPQAGAVQIKGFTLRNEPALARIMAQGNAGSAMPEDRGGTQANTRADTNDVAFDRLRANFLRSGNRVDFRDAAISGPAMGFTLNGWLDTGRDRTDISGTFVPLYGLNNAFAQVPIVGLFLGGGQNEGLFAINFRVVGPLSGPSVNVNPLSAIAPGFLRKLFGAGGGEDLAGSGLPQGGSER